MATITKEVRSPRPAAEVWALLRDFAAVHELAKGFVASTEMEPSGARLVTFVNGVQVREWLVSADDQAMRLVYAINDSPNYTHYSAAAQVVPDEEGSRFVWTVDFLPDAMAPAQDAAMAAGIAAIGRNLGAAR
ncbi:MAG TPA: SRPBCC family protein [Terricaulis sp.]|nr:SRPBCC family protein [Terricaulis sp.]